MFILKMLEDGKISAEEAAALLEALQDDEGDARRADDAGSGSDSARRAHGRKAPQDLASQISETIQSALRNVPNLTDDVRDGWKEMRDDMRVALGDLRDELKKKKLIDLSGFSELLSHMREVGYGQAHEFEERISGTFADGTAPVRVELVTKNGNVQVQGWDRPDFEVVLRKKVYRRDEASAKETADAAVRVEVEKDRVVVDGRGGSTVTVAIEARLPKSRLADLDAESQNGSVTVRGLTLVNGRAATTNGSVDVAQIAARRMHASTVNGRVVGEAVDAESCDVTTVNGSVEWAGASTRLNVKSVNGGVRIAPEPPAKATEYETSPAEVQMKSVNGSLRVTLPARVAIEVDAQARSVHLGEADTGLAVDEQTGKAGVNRRVRASRQAQPSTQTQFPERRALQIAAKTVNGSIRFDGDGRKEKPGSGGAVDGEAESKNS